MSRKTNWNRIKREYEKGGVTLKQLAKHYNVNLGTLQHKQYKEKWISAAPVRGGNPNPQNQFKKGNLHAMTHGFSVNYFLHMCRAVETGVAPEWPTVEEMRRRLESRIITRHVRKRMPVDIPD